MPFLFLFCTAYFPEIKKLISKNNSMSENNSRRFMRIVVGMAMFMAIFTNTGAANASELTPEKIVELTNQSRKEAGLKPLNADPKLALAASEKARDMFANQYFEHISPAGVTPWHWFNAVGYNYTYAAENLAKDFATAEGAHSALMKSTGHRENILGANYKDIGIAVVTGTFNGKNSVIVVEEFGTSKEQGRYSDPFFESAAQEAAQPVGRTIEASKTEMQECGKRDCNTQEICNRQDCDREDARGNNNEYNLKNNNEKNTGNEKNALENVPYGKIVPEIYSIRETRTLKKVYTENIYWKEAGKNDFANYLASSKAKLKSVLRSVTKGNCCKSIDNE